MARGAVAKEEVTRKIMEAFGVDFVGEADKKLYVWANDGGERVQIAIAMTCPKSPIAAPGGDLASNVPKEDNGDWDFSDDGSAQAAPVGYQPAEISAEEQARAVELMERLNL